MTGHVSAAENTGQPYERRGRSWARGATAVATAQELARETKRGASARICTGKRKDRGTESRAAPGPCIQSREASPMCYLAVDSPSFKGHEMAPHAVSRAAAKQTA